MTADVFFWSENNRYQFLALIQLIIDLILSAVFCFSVAHKNAIQEFHKPLDSEKKATGSVSYN